MANLIYFNIREKNRWRTSTGNRQMENKAKNGDFREVPKHQFWPNFKTVKERAKSFGTLHTGHNRKPPTKFGPIPNRTATVGKLCLRSKSD